MADTIPGNADTHTIKLADGRTVSYAHNGSPSSRTVTLFYTGVFGVGRADTLLPSISSTHFIAITPVGWGETSPRLAAVSYVSTIISDATAVLDHLHPDGIDGLYVSGGSFGTVPAQILFGNEWKYAPKLKGCMLVAGFSPFKYHQGYTGALSWANYFAVGPPALMPFHAGQRAAKVVIGNKFKTERGTIAFLEETLFAHVDAEEQEMMDKWLVKVGRTREQFIKDMAGNVRASIAHTWEGFMETADILHSDWGFDPRKVSGRGPVLVVGSRNDKIGGAMNGWLQHAYAGAKGQTTGGGHIGSLFVMDELWAELLALAGETK